VRGRLRNFSPPEMASKTLGVVKSRIRSNGLMGIVACKAAYACICGVKAAAVSEAIGLKAHVNNSLQVHHLNLLPASVAGAAEIREVLGVEATRIKDVQVFQSTRPDRGYMRSARPVTTLTGDARHEFVQLQAVAADGSR